MKNAKQVKQKLWDSFAWNKMLPQLKLYQYVWKMHDHIWPLFSFTSAETELAIHRNREEKDFLPDTRF